MFITFLKKKNSYICFFIVFFLFQISVFSNSYKTLRIGLGENLKKVVLSSENGFLIKGKGFEKRFLNKSIQFVKSGNNVRFLNISRNESDINIYPVNNGLIEYKDYKYRGFFRLINNRNSMNIVNVINTEFYLYGVLANEILRSSPMEALKTLAIVTRTYALKNLNKHGVAGYDLCNTTDCQVYKGYNTETENIIKAVDQTRGIVIISEGNLISAYHHSACGGGTANNEDVWEGDAIAYTRGKWCDYCKESPRSSWDFDLDLNDLSKKLRNYKIGKILRINIDESDIFGRVKSFSITGTEKEIIIQANRFRLLIGAHKMWNTMVQLKGYGGNSEKLNNKINTLSTILENNKKFFIKKIIQETEEKRNNIYYTGYKIVGSGSGHGVGLCQWGAIGLSKKGFMFKEIINFYYTGVELKKIY